MEREERMQSRTLRRNFLKNLPSILSWSVRKPNSMMKDGIWHTTFSFSFWKKWKGIEIDTCKITHWWMLGRDFLILLTPDWEFWIVFNPAFFGHCEVCVLCPHNAAAHSLWEHQWSWKGQLVRNVSVQWSRADLCARTDPIRVARITAVTRNPNEQVEGRGRCLFVLSFFLFKRNGDCFSTTLHGVV